MVFRSACKMLPTVKRTCLDKSRHQLEAARNVQSAFLPQENDLTEIPEISIKQVQTARSASPRRKDYVLFKPYKHIIPRKPNFRHRRGENIGERLQVLGKLIRFSDEEVKELCKNAPRLVDIKLFDEVLRNIECLLYVYKHNQVVWLLRNRITILTQIDNVTLMSLLDCKGKVPNITDLIQIMESTTKDTDSHSFLDSFDTSFESREKCEIVEEIIPEKKTDCTSDNGHLLNSTVQEKTEFLYSEGLSKEFLQNNDFILKYSMKRLQKEILYIKRELGELDPQVLASRIKGVPKKVIFYRSRKVAAKLLGCTEKVFTELQSKYLFSLYPGVVKDSITHLLTIGFTTEDIKSCVYIIGQSSEEIDKARKDVIEDGDIDTTDSQKLINAILYKIKKSDGR